MSCKIADRSAERSANQPFGPHCARLTVMHTSKLVSRAWCGPVPWVTLRAADQTAQNVWHGSIVGHWRRPTSYHHTRGPVKSETIRPQGG